MLSDALSWLDTSPARYWSVAWGAFGVTAAVAIAAYFVRRGHAWRRQPVVFPALFLFVLFAFRWPVLLDNQQLPDPDESQLMSGAITLRHDPRFWLSVDGTTHGPLAGAPLLVPLLAGSSVDYTAARTLSVVLVWVTLVSAWLIFRHVFGARPAGLLVLPLLATHAFTHAWSFVAFCSEHVPVALLAAGCAALFMAWDRTGRGLRPWLLFGAGGALGAVPFAKLQAAPIAAAAIIGGILLVLLTFNSNLRERWRGIGALVCGVTILPAIILGAVLTGGIWAEFWQSYILNNLQYAGGRWFTWAETPGKFIELGGEVEGFNAFFPWLLGFTGCALVAVRRFDSWHRRCTTLAAALLLAAAYATMAPGRMFMHYLQLLLFPTALLAGLAAGSLLDVARGGRRVTGWLLRITQPIVLATFLSCGLAAQVFWRAQSEQPFLGRFVATRGELIQSVVAQEILRYANAGERLGMWGWMPTFWVQTGMLQGTRDGNTSRQIEPIADRAYYRTRYLRDLRETNPPVFIDAVGEGNFSYADRAASAHETFPELHTHVSENYRLVCDVEGTRIYVRNDRLAGTIMSSRR